MLLTNYYWFWIQTVSFCQNGADWVVCDHLPAVFCEYYLSINIYAVLKSTAAHCSAAQKGAAEQWAAPATGCYSSLSWSRKESLPLKWQKAEPQFEGDGLWDKDSSMVYSLNIDISLFWHLGMFWGVLGLFHTMFFFQASEDNLQAGRKSFSFCLRAPSSHGETCPSQYVKIVFIMKGFNRYGPPVSSK